MMRLSSCSKAIGARRLYWCLGISSLLLVAAIIGTHKPTDLRFRAMPRLKTHHEKTKQSTGLHFESKVAGTLSLPTTVGLNHLERNATEAQSLLQTVRHPDWNASLSEYTAFGLYIYLDNASLESGNAENQWENLNHSISSTCHAVDKLHVRILIDRKDSRRSDIRKFIARYFETTDTLCEEFGTSTEFRTVEVGSVRQSARRLTQLMSSDYVVERIAYFSLIFIPNIIDHRGFPDQLQLLLDRSSDGVGLVADYARDSMLPSSLFFGNVHGEIFGWFLPPFLSDIKLALTYTIHLYPENLRTITARNESMVNSILKGMMDPKSSGFSTAGIRALELDKDTLRRYLSVSRTSACFRCPNNTSRKIIAMSLYGKNGRYTMGAIRNAQLLPVTFPGWRLWVYVERQLPGRRPYSYGQVPPTVLAKLVELGAEIRYVGVNRTGLAPMLWRFTVTEDPDVDVFIVRDCDSRLTPRDAAVVADWLRTGKIFHCVRDHPSHSRYPVSGGLWGARRKPLLTIFGEGRLSGVMRRYGSGYVQDMNFLAREVWPKVKNVAYCHDSYSCQRYPASHPFPVARVGAEHLGQVYDEFSIGRKSDMDTVLRTPVNTKCVVVVPPKNNSAVP